MLSRDVTCLGCEIIDQYAKHSDTLHPSTALSLESYPMMGFCVQPIPVLLSVNQVATLNGFI